MRGLFVRLYKYTLSRIVVVPASDDVVFYQGCGSIDSAQLWMEIICEYSIIVCRTCDGLVQASFNTVGVESSKF